MMSAGWRSLPCLRCRNGLSDERGSATVMSIGVLAAMAVLASGVATLAAAVEVKHRVSSAADLAALAAADVASGRRAGAPCPEAERVAEANRAHLSDCSVQGAVVTVTVSSAFLGFGVTSDARAGPPGTGRSGYQSKIASR